jgi:hypothetical protein
MWDAQYVLSLLNKRFEGRFPTYCQDTGTDSCSGSLYGLHEKGVQEDFLLFVTELYSAN